MNQRTATLSEASRILPALLALLLFAMLFIGTSVAAMTMPQVQAVLAAHVAYVLLSAAACFALALAAARPLFALVNDLSALGNRLSRMADAGQLDAVDLNVAPPLAAFTNSMRRLIEHLAEGGREAEEIRATNRVLAREMGRLFKLLDALGDGVLLVDSAQRILYASRNAGAFLTLTPEEATGRTVKECIAGGPMAEFLSENAPTGSEARGARVLELSPDAKTGQGHTAVIQSAAYSDQGAALGQIVLFRDESRIKNMERLQTEFVDSVAHELRTPLTSIRAYVEMLIDGEAEDPDMQRNFFNVIYEETHRLSVLIDNLLNISMMESGMVKLDVTPTRLKRLLEDAVDVVRAQCEQKQIVLTADLPDRLPTMNLDKRLFTVSVMNILSNAAKYTPARGEVSIYTSSHEDEFWISVRDSGIGISPEDQARIFDKFYRAAAAESEQGSGVGLATAREIVRLHGGDIRVTSRIGEGSIFVISLPRTLINTSIGE